MSKNIYKKMYNIIKNIKNVSLKFLTKQTHLISWNITNLQEKHSSTHFSFHMCFASLHINE